MLDALRTAHARGARIASICTGAFVLGAAGLLDGRRATTHWRYAAQLADLLPEAHVDPDVLYVDDGDVLTSAGVAAGIDLCLHVVRRDHGAEAANGRTPDRRRAAPRRRAGAVRRAPVAAARAPAASRRRAHGLAHLDEPLTVAQLARHAVLQRAHLRPPLPRRPGPRRCSGCSPSASLDARRLLEATDLPVEPVARAAASGPRPRCASTSAAPPRRRRRPIAAASRGSPT